MLQPKQKKTYGDKCIKPIILFVLFIAGFFLAFVPWIFIFLFFSMAKTSRGIKRNLTISEIIDISGITDCIQDFNGLKSTTNTKISYKSKSKENFDIKKSKKNNDNFYSLNSVTNRERFKKESKKLENIIKTNTTNSVFDGHKSIWDDYESVLDIMKKNQTK